LFDRFAHDPQSILAALKGLAFVRVESCLNIPILELNVTPFAYANDRRAFLYDPQFSLLHDCSLARLARRA